MVQKPERFIYGWLPKKFSRNTKGVLSGLGVRRNLVGEIINLFREGAEFVNIRSEDNLSQDPDDNVFCACAEQGRASFYCHAEQGTFPPKEPDRQGDFAR
jgi:hypothetical protein